MSIYEKAQDLAYEIETSPELRRVKEAELRLMIDLTARQIVEEYQNIQVEAINNGISFDDLSEDKKNRLSELEKQMSENQIIVDYMNANQELNQILESINMIITSALHEKQDSGCSGCASAGDCSDGSCCSSCGH